jgi:hypothetical protein
MTGNPNIHFPDNLAGTNRIKVIDVYTGEPVWESFPLPAEIEEVRVDTWNGKFITSLDGGSVLPAGKYKVLFETTCERKTQEVLIEVAERKIFSSRFSSDLETWFEKDVSRHAEGAWEYSQEGITARGQAAFLFVDGAMHGTLEGAFILGEVPAAANKWGLIARHYNAFMDVKVLFTRNGNEVDIQLVKVFNSTPDPNTFTILAREKIEFIPHRPYRFRWVLNGRRHEVWIDGRRRLCAQTDFMGGVTVVGIFSDPDTVAWTDFGMATSAFTPTYAFRQEDYEAVLRPGNIFKFKLLQSERPDQNLFWESGIQFGHIGGSEIKFSQSAQLVQTEQGTIYQQVRWQGPMPKFVDQSQDVRGWAHGMVSFYPDRIVLADFVLPWTKRSVGPDFDLFASMMDGPARIAIAGERTFTEWHLPENGGTANLNPTTCEKTFPVAVAFPFRLGRQRWWLKAVIDNLLHVDGNAPASIFAWRCPNGLTASHDFRVAPCTPGTEYGFSVVVSWQQAEDFPAVADDLLRLRDEWMLPMTIEPQIGKLLTFKPGKEHPAQALTFDGCFDRASGMYHILLDQGVALLQLSPGSISRRSTVFCFHSILPDMELSCSLDNQPLKPDLDYLEQALGNQCRLVVFTETIDKTVTLKCEAKQVLCPETSQVSPRSDGRTLHVDFEAYQDGVVGLLNAGVRSLGDPFTNLKQKEVAIVNDPTLAFSGARCGYVWTSEPDEIGRIRLQRRFDSPTVPVDEITEFVFRSVCYTPVDLDHFVLWSGKSFAGTPVGIVLTAWGSAETGTYRIDVEDADGQHANGVSNLSQSEWIRIILHRNREDKTCVLWMGPPDREKRIAAYRDLDPSAATELAEFGDLSSHQDRGSGFWDDIRVGGILRARMTLSPPETFRHVGNETPKIEVPIRVGTEKQLFVDDVTIQSLRGLKRSFHPVDKHSGNPLMVPDRPWETQAKCILPLTVLPESETGKLRLWYSAWGKQVEKPTFECLALSNDGLRWEKPELGLCDFEGSTKNNIIREGRMFRVLFDPLDKAPNYRYKAVIRDSGFFAAHSPNGLEWTTTVPVLEQAYDASSVHWDPVNRKWIASCKVFVNGKRSRGYAESTDFTHWTDTCLMLTPDERDQPSDHLYSLSIFRYESVYIGLLKVFHTDTDRCEIQLAFSRNAKHWIRPDRTPFIPNPLEKEAWDFGNIDDTGQPIQMGDELWFYYAGRSTLHYQMPNDGAMGLGTLRLDGFCSLDAGSEEGILITPPLRLDGDSLFLNAEVRDGYIKVEVLEETACRSVVDEADLPIHPFLKARCVPVTGNSVRQEVQWKNSPRFGRLNQNHKLVRLKFYIKNAGLFSFWME